MKKATGWGFAALLMTAGVPAADEPMVLNERQLDRITAGAEFIFPGVFLQEVPGTGAEPPPPGNLVIQFEEHSTQGVRGILQNSADPRWDAADPGFHLVPPRRVITGRVPNPDSGG
jgi:hypothetical protein